MLPRFRWITFDVNDLLPPRWQEGVRALAANDFRRFPRTPVISREAAHVSHISRGRVHEVRILADMNFYPESCPESTRPKEINRHLYGDA